MCKILVVDDTPDFRNTLSGLLTDEGYAVWSAANEAHTLAAVTQEPFDFALIDVRLHGDDEEDESGLSLAMAVKSLDPKVHIILLTRYVKTKQIIRATQYLNLSESDFIEKAPGVGEQILKTITDARGKTERAKIEERVQPSDNYSPYETGLHQLLSRIGKNYPLYRETLVYQQRLVENISLSRLYSDTDTRRADRSEIIGRLNDIALATLGVSFNELCNPTLVEANKEHRQSQHTERGRNHMDWNTIVSLAVSAVSPYAIAFATSAASAAGKELIEAASENIKGLWQWIRETVSGSDDEPAKHAWESFKKDPQSNRDALVGVIRRLSPDDDTVLRGYVQGIIQEAQSRKGADLVSLLDNTSYYTFNDLMRICSRVNPQWEGEVGSPTRENLARWVVNYAPTRNKQPDLIAAMLEVNPTVMLQ